MNLQNLFMKKQKIKKKFIFLGEEDSINIELIINLSIFKNKVHYILLCNKEDIIKNIYFKKYQN